MDLCRKTQEDALADHVPTLASETGASNAGNRQAHFNSLTEALQVNEDLTDVDCFSLVPMPVPLGRRWGMFLTGRPAWNSFPVSIATEGAKVSEQGKFIKCRS